MQAVISCLSALLFVATSLPAKSLRTGTRIPDVSVLTANGKKVRLRSALEQKPAVLIFYRGGWCPYCVKHLQALMDIEAELIAAGYQLLAMRAFSSNR